MTQNPPVSLASQAQYRPQVIFAHAMPRVTPMVVNSNATPLSAKLTRLIDRSRDVVKILKTSLADETNSYSADEQGVMV